MQTLTHRERGPADFDYQVINAFVNSGTKGILSGFKGHPDHLSSRLQLAFYLDRPGSFRAEYMIGNYTDVAVDYILYLLVDYKQQEFLIARTKAKVYRLSLQPQERRILPLEVASLVEGAHDLLLLAVRQEPEPSEVSKRDYGLLTHRANIFVSGSSFPVVQYQGFRETLNAEGLNSITLTLHADEKVSRTVPAQLGNEAIASTYYLYVTNPHDRPIQYASILFATTNPTTRASALAEVVFHSQGAKTTSVIPIAPAGLRTHGKLWAITIENPYTVLEPRHESMAQIPTAVRLSNIILPPHIEGAAK